MLLVYSVFWDEGGGRKNWEGGQGMEDAVVHHTRAQQVIFFVLGLLRKPDVL